MASCPFLALKKGYSGPRRPSSKACVSFAQNESQYSAWNLQGESWVTGNMRVLGGRMPILPIIVRYVMFAVVVFAIAAHAKAGTVQKLVFKQDGMAVVWYDGALLGKASEIELVPASEALSQADYMGGGQLQAVTASFEPQNSVRFQIASNTGFRIETLSPVEPGSIKVRVTNAGSNASYKMAPGREGQRRGAGTVIFAQHGKTAEKPGSPISQAIEVEVSWSGDLPSLILRTN